MTPQQSLAAVFLDTLFPLSYQHSMTHVKDFAGWNTVKIQLDAQHHAPTFQEREIWWCSVGLNIGDETNGKNKAYNRPVLILRKFNRQIFWGIPLSTKIKNSPHYHRIVLHDKEQSAMITPLRLFDSKRITHKMGQISPSQFAKVQQAVVDAMLKKQKPR